MILAQLLGDPQTTRCPGCGRAHDASVLTCDCGFDLQAYRRQRRERVRDAQGGYRLLRVAVVVLWLLAVLVTVAGLAGAYILHADGASWQALGVLAGAALNSFVYVALAVTVARVIELAAEQRATRDALQHLREIAAG